MNNEKLLFNFADLSSKDRAAQKAIKAFSRAGAHVVQADASGAVKRTSGVSYREMVLLFADSQSVTLRIKQSGDIYEVMLNGRAVPIKYQDDHLKAIAEIAALMDKGRTLFQAKLAKAKAAVPKSIRTAAPKIEAVLIEKRDALKSAIADLDVEIGELEAKLAA